MAAAGAMPGKTPQVPTEVIHVGTGRTMGRAGVDDQPDALYLRGLDLIGDLDRNHLIVVTVNYQGQHVELLQVFAKVGRGD